MHNMRIIIGMAVLMTETILNKPVMWGQYFSIGGAFLICMAMSGSGPRTLPERPISDWQPGTWIVNNGPASLSTEGLSGWFLAQL